MHSIHIHVIMINKYYYATFLSFHYYQWKFPLGRICNSLIKLPNYIYYILMCIYIKLFPNCNQDVVDFNYNWNQFICITADLMRTHK